MKKQIKLKFTEDFPENRYRLIKDKLEERFDIVFSDEPDYIFCGCYSDEFLKYDCVKVLFMGENISPDFNVYDYAVGPDPIQFGDRYLQYPLSLCDKTSLELGLKKHEHVDSYYLNREGFCNFVYSNNGCSNPMRMELFNKLSSQYKRVDSGGRLLNNMGERVGDKHAFLEKYKFTLAIENSSYPGYSTEKIMDAFAAGSIPIYWGDPEINKIFNERAFIRVSDYESIEACIEKIKEIDTNEDLYLAMQRECILPDNQIIHYEQDNNPMAAFIAGIFDRPYEDAKRICDDGYVREYRKVLVTGWKWYMFPRKVVRVARKILKR